MKKKTVTIALPRQAPVALDSFELEEFDGPNAFLLRMAGIDDFDDPNAYDRLRVWVDGEPAMRVHWKEADPYNRHVVLVVLLAP